MKKLGLHEIRREFLDFFEEKSHLIIPSYSLVPQKDKSLLLIGAGMAPLKKFFTGEAKPKENRMASCQKCIRTGDIENVGITARHGTFFEMLGNFSFGDYFKEEAIEWAWEFLVGHLELDPEHIWVTVYKDDDEAEKIWNEKIGVPMERIVRLGKEDNFWELEVGPSGPCSEIYVDRGEGSGCGEATCKPGCDCDRFLEIWNLVFTQFDKDTEGNYNPLPNPNIDTGMGLERIAAYMEGVESIFEIEAIRDILNKIEEISGIDYGRDQKVDISMRIITDHARAMTFLVSDKVIPSNEGRGYVLRRLIRRAARHGKLLGIETAFLGQVVEEVINSWSVQYKELAENKEEIKRIIKNEEKKFQETIDQGLEILEDYIGQIKADGKKLLDGERAFKLYDTYGFPLDLTKEILIENKLEVDEAGFNDNMEKQRQMARAARNTSEAGWVSGEDIKVYKDLKTSFEGYSSLESDSQILGIFKDGKSLEALEEGETAVVIVENSPFYAESGGQVGDSGEMITEDARLLVMDTQKTKKNHRLHIVKLESGSLGLGDRVKLGVDSLRRNLIMRNHTATHLLHRALKDVLGEGVNQAGSVVEDARLRFDFTHAEAIRPEDLDRIEEIVNARIFEALETNIIETSMDEASSLGAVGLFEDKYGDQVRVLSIGDYSVELCGGTHVRNTSEIGIFKIISESGISSGVRRIEAVTSRGAYEYLRSLDDYLDDLAGLMKSNRSNLRDRSKSLMEEVHSMNKELDGLRNKLAASASSDLINKKEIVEGIPFISAKIDNMDMKGLRDLGDELKNKLGSGLVVLAGLKDAKLFFVVTATKDIVAKGIHSGNIIREVAKVTGGSGGGRPDMAQAGGKDISKLDEALELSRQLVKEQLK